MNIKGFDKELKCRGFQFEIGKEYKIDTEKPLKLCTDTVFHYCKDIKNVHNYYSCKENNRYCEIEVLGEEIGDGEKFGSNHIKIVREMFGEELNILLGKTNGNTGLFNTGNNNSGYRNSGNNNSGYRNSGNYNTGNNNSGNYNSGYCNTGYCNSGNYNTGNYNTGNYNSGNWNSGNWNKCDYSSGFFCTEEPKCRIFNIDTDMTVNEFRKSKWYKALSSSFFALTEWIFYTDEEKSQDKEKELIGGYLKEYTYKEACQNWWNNMTKKNKGIIKTMPNFNAEIFKEITGIDVKGEEK